MKKKWWKIAGVLILLYTFLIGLLTPLKTGISDISPQLLHSGDTITLQITGYNSHYRSVSGQLKAWLKIDTVNALHASEIRAISERELELVFQLPKFLPSDRKQTDCSLLIDSPLDGAHVYPGGLSILQDSVNTALAGHQWTSTPIEHLHERKAITFPFRNILGETIRNTYFHVPLWFAMFILFVAALIHSIRTLRKGDPDADHKAAALTEVGMLFGALGLATGAVWAKYTWGAFWSWDVKQNMTAVGLLIYGAYFVLRTSFEDPERKARISAVYNIFAFSTLIPLLYVIPKLTDSLHPGAGGNIAFGSEDLDNTMRLVFYPAILGWALMGFWMAQLIFRMRRLKGAEMERF